MFSSIGIGILKGISHLPFRILYAISDLTYYIVYYVLKYRRTTVYKNLRNSFPEKSDSEIEAIAKRYYRHLCDLIVEGIKTYSISREEIMDRLHVLNPEELTKWSDLGRSTVSVLGHYGNWEYAALGYTAMKQRHEIQNITYKPISDPAFNSLFLYTRSRFGAHMLSMKETFIRVAHEQRDQILSNIILVSDQTPSKHHGYWMEFLNQDTPVFLGAEKIAKRYNMPLVFVHLNRVKRGFYEVTLETIHENPSETKDGELTELHTQVLETDIKNNPEIWLWSHKRWKHSRP